MSVVAFTFNLKKQKNKSMCTNNNEGRKEMFYLTMHSTHFNTVICKGPFL